MRLAVHEAGRGPVVVLLHGLFGSARNLGGLQRALADRFRVLALDLRNHGDSLHDPAMDYTVMALDVLETLEAARAVPAALVGHSMGGKVAMTVALRRPELVRRLVVADIAPVTYPSHFGAFVAAMLAVSSDASRVAAETALLAAIPDKAIRGFLLHNFRSGAGWRIGLAEIAAALPTIEAWEESGFAAYAGPALFVTGERSDYVPKMAQPAIRTLFPAARFVAIRDAGHWLHAEQPEAFNRTVGAFLAPLLAA